MIFCPVTMKPSKRSRSRANVWLPSKEWPPRGCIFACKEVICRFWVIGCKFELFISVLPNEQAAWLGVPRSLSSHLQCWSWADKLVPTSFPTSSSIFIQLLVAWMALMYCIIYFLTVRESVDWVNLYVIIFIHIFSIFSKRISCAIDKG